jgi:hypothetical protein
LKHRNHVFQVHHLRYSHPCSRSFWNFVSYDVSHCVAFSIPYDITLGFPFGVSHRVALGFPYDVTYLSTIISAQLAALSTAIVDAVRKP